MSEIEYAIEMIAPIMSEIFNDASAYINLRWCFNNFLKRDLSDEEVRDSKILGIQFSGIELLDDG
ncbi:2358_t:CDS:2, partial [Gigaspora margarita]